MATWVLSPVAESELAEILDYIADQSGSRHVVENVLDDFIKAFEELAAAPGIGFRRTRLTGHNVRWWPVHRRRLTGDQITEPREYCPRAWDCESHALLSVSIQSRFCWT